MAEQRVLLVSAAYTPLTHFGGLDTAVAGLGNALHRKGVDVRVLLPGYGRGSDYFNSDKKFVQDSVKADYQKAPLQIGTVTENGVPVHFMSSSDLGDPFLRSERYVYANLAPDPLDAAYRLENQRTFRAAQLFSATIPQVLHNLETNNGWKPDVIHFHDWFPAMGVYWLSTDPQLKSIPTLLTMHHGKYLGKVPLIAPTKWDDAIPPESPFNKMLRVAMIDGDKILFTLDETASHVTDNPRAKPNIETVISVEGKNFLSAFELGARYASTLSTVSEAYLQQVLNGHSSASERVRQLMGQKKAVAIPNGIDTIAMNPKTDPYIYNFDPADSTSVDRAKEKNKRKLYQNQGLSWNTDTPLVTMMCRLSDEKGIGEVLKAIPEIQNVGGLNLLIIGETYDGQTRMQVQNLGGNTAGRPYVAKADLQHLVLAASDGLLITSKEEPFGLILPEGLRYGALPIHTNAGGLKETSVPHNLPNGYSIPMSSLDPKEIAQALATFLSLVKSQAGQVARHHALHADFSWERPDGPADKHIALYQELITPKSK